MVPEGWKLSTLGKICLNHLQTGPFGSQLHAEEYQSFGVPVYMPKDLRSYRANPTLACKVTTEKANSLIRHKVKIGDLLFSRRGDVARCAVITNDSAGGLCGTGCLRARPQHVETGIYISFFLQRKPSQEWLKKNAVGQTMLNLNTTILSELPILLPPLPEQKKIASILSTWDKAIETVDKLIENSKQQKKALMQQLLTGKKRLPGFSGEWKEVRLGDVCAIKTGKKDVKEGNPNGKYLFFTCAANHTYCDTYSFDTEAILIAGNGAIGTTHYYAGKFEAYQRTYVLSEFSRAKCRFLLHHIDSFFMRDVLREKQHGAMPYIKLGLLKNYRLSLPKEDEQLAITHLIDTAESILQSFCRCKDNLKKQKQALMQQLLTGKRRVTVTE